MKSFTTYKIATEHADLTVESYLKQILQFSGRKLQKLTRQKGVFLNNKVVFLQKKIKQGDTLRILQFEDATYGVQPEQGAIEILYENDSLFVLHKPAGQLVHPTGQTTSGTLANYLAYHLQERGIISTIRPLHRLDRETSGCIIFAKDAHSQCLLEQQLKDHSCKRQYLALVHGIVCPSSGTIDQPIGAHPTLANRRSITPNGERAVTHYQLVEHLPNSSLLQLSLETGRTHQIRLHVAHMGHPIIGDRMYGTRSPWIARQALHATSISFIDSKTNSEITVHAPLPADFAHALACYAQK